MDQDKKGIVPTMIDAAAKATIEIHSVRRNISVLGVAGGKHSVLTGKDCNLLIDASFTASKLRLTEELNKLSADAITHLINTHGHTAHTDGNACVQAAGEAITAHTNTKKHLATSTPV